MKLETKMTRTLCRMAALTLTGLSTASATTPTTPACAQVNPAGALVVQMEPGCDKATFHAQFSASLRQALQQMNHGQLGTNAEPAGHDRRPARVRSSIQVRKPDLVWRPPQGFKATPSAR